MTDGKQTVLAFAKSEDIPRLLRMVPIARLAAHGMRVGRLVEDHPTSHVYGQSTASLVGMHVMLDPDDPFLAACDEEFHEGFRDFTVVVDVEFQFVRFILLPTDRTKPSCTIEWSMREDRSEIDFEDVPTNHDVAAIADQAGDLLSEVMKQDGPESIAARGRLVDAASSLRNIAYAVLGREAEVQVLSNDIGSDLIVLASVESETRGDSSHDVRFSPELMRMLAVEPQFEFHLKEDRHQVMDAADGNEARWTTSYSYGMMRRSAWAGSPDVVDLMEAMRSAAQYHVTDGRLAWIEDDRMDDLIC
jgi:hypothetical protein